MASTPLIAVYLLRDLHFNALEYGIALGVPCAAGVAGSLLAPAIIRRAGLGRTLLYGGAARCLWMGPILLAPPTTTGLVLIIAADSALLVGSHVRCHRSDCWPAVLWRRLIDLSPDSSHRSVVSSAAAV